jgi:hypothetical protein
MANLDRLLQGFGSRISIVISVLPPEKLNGALALISSAVAMAR